VDKQYETVELERDGQVLTIRIKPTRPPLHWDLGEIFSDLRGDDSVRVIVLTGLEDGIFSVGPRTAKYDSEEGRAGRNDPHKTWRIFTGLIRCHEAMASIEKPIVARVNGDAVSFGASLMFGCDFIVGREDAQVYDYHLAMGEHEPYGPRYGIVPGDGGLALVPLYLAPPLAKEYLMLGRRFTCAELAARGLINDAVPLADLDARVDDVVRRLLGRSAYALAWTKRVANRRIVEHLNLTLDAAAAYEMVNFHQIERQGWKDRFDL
jgi:enoyl-CoA hydratase